MDGPDEIAEPGGAPSHLIQWRHGVRFLPLKSYGVEALILLGSLNALQKALASGTLTVTFEGRSMTYRSVQELQPAISVVQSSLNQQSGKRVRQYRLSGSKGF